MEKIIQSIQAIYPISKENITLLLDEMEKITLLKGEILVNTGEKDNNLYLVEKGILRAHFLYEGTEMTYWFASENEEAYSSWGYVANQVSLITIEAACESVVYRISKTRLEFLYSTSLELANWGRKLVERRFLEIDSWLINYSIPRAEARYETLLRKNPEILQQIPLKHIATYLWITPQSLSRIRAEYRKRKTKYKT